MKNSTIILCIILAFAAISLRAATLTVNNSTPSPGQYSRIDSAMAKAANGDTILIKGTATSYGNVTITKPITLRGTGWNPLYKQYPYATTIGSIGLAGGVNNVVIEGLDFSSLYMNSPYGQYNITVQLCRVSSLSWSNNCHDFIFRNNYCTAGISGSATGAYNLTATNNIITGGVGGFSNPVNIVIEHNLFMGGSIGSSNGLFIYNNIFYNSYVSGSLTNCNFINNLTYSSSGASTALPTSGGTDGNVVSYTGADLRNVNPLFVSKSCPSCGFSQSDNYRLQASSPAKGAGIDGRDLGIYTDINVFSMTGEPKTPAVRTFQIRNTVTTPGSNLIIELTASKAHIDNNN